MSTEQVLLLVAFLVLPLVQYLLRVSRQRQGIEPAKADGRPSPDRPPLPELLPRRAMEDRALSDATTTPERQPALAVDRPVAPPLRQRTRRAKAAIRLHDPSDLRRAIVLMTVIEPCRAIQPHD